MKGSRFTAFVAIVGSIGLIAGCSSSQSPSPAVSGSPSESAAASPSASSSSSLAPTPTPSAAPSASPAPSATAVSAVAAAPDGQWTSLGWLNPGPAFPRLKQGSSEIFQLQLYGWSHGYVAFGSDGGQGTSQRPTLVSTSSPDGVHWAAPSAVNIGNAPDQIDIVQVAEGPTGLLAVGHFPADTCGGPPVIAGLWHSTDGTSWQAVALPDSMTHGHVETLDGGSAGYIATGDRTDGTPGIWLSLNATTWKQLPRPKPASGILVVNGAVSFSGGLVVAGAVVGPEGCGGGSSIHPAVWWSVDGSSWTREPLPKASTALSASLTIEKMSDDELVAIDNSGDSPKAWISSDGRQWTAIAAPTDEALYGTFTDGRRSIYAMAGPDDLGPLTYSTVDDQLHVAPLAQTGDGPSQTADSASWISAVGPSGIVALTSDGSELRLGLPSGS
jgi:hypothetical protein